MGITFDDVSYEGTRFSFEIELSKITGIIGKSGSGKSKIVDLISGLCDCEYGDIYLPYDAGVVYQDCADQFYFDNVRDNFNFIIKMHGLSNSRIYKALKMIGLDSSYLDKNYYELSLSERKLISFGLAISFNPKVLILDDVFFGLDLEGKRRIIKLIRMMKMRYGKTIVILSRDANLIHSICDDVILLNDGIVVKKGNKYDIFTDDDVLKKCGIEMPNVLKFSKLMKKKLNKKVIYRDDINDLAKDIYRAL